MIIDSRTQTKQTKYREFTLINAVCAFAELLPVGEFREVEKVIDPTGKVAEIAAVRMCLNKIKTELGVKTVTRINKESGSLFVWRVG
jgi:hypothetical protein